MKLHTFSLCLFACTACAFDVDDFLDRLDSTLTLSAFHDNFRARLSGTLDLEIYNFDQPASNPLSRRANWITDLFLRAVAARSRFRSQRSRRSGAARRICTARHAVA